MFFISGLQVLFVFVKLMLALLGLYALPVDSEMMSIDVSFQASN